MRVGVKLVLVEVDVEAAVFPEDAVVELAAVAGGHALQEAVGVVGFYNDKKCNNAISKSKSTALRNQKGRLGIVDTAQNQRRNCRF